jgi:lipopolysaccharide transport system ATP-binding protein
MSSDDIAIRVRDVSKHYVLFDRPEDRLKQMVIPRLERMAGRTPRRYYRDFAALTDVSFEVKRGETVGIIGRNGSGKSTLLQIICGTLQPTRGKVDVNGRIAALLELGAGFNPDFTGRENVLLNAAIMGLSRSEIDSRFDDIARFADIGAFIDQPVKTYSSGMYVRLAFATAINVDPDILVVDEALAVGDEAFQRKCYARIEEIKERGGTILFVSHGAQTIVQLCTRALLFDRGELLLEGRPKTVVAQYQRLANLTGDQACAARETLKATNHSRSEANGHENDFLPNSALAIAPSDPAPLRTSPAENESRVLEYYDPGLVSRSHLEYETQGAQISNVRIENAQGHKVNVLVKENSYRIAYEVSFVRTAAAVAFGAGIKTKTGIQIAGMTTRLSAALKGHKVVAGTAETVTIDFTCALNEGTYFVNCGVRGTIDQADLYLSRCTDALIFKVVSARESMATDFVDLGFRVAIQGMDGNQANNAREPDAIA